MENVVDVFISEKLVVLLFFCAEAKLSFFKEQN